jgi:hypothetical protein
VPSSLGPWVQVRILHASRCMAAVPIFADETAAALIALPHLALKFGGEGTAGSLGLAHGLAARRADGLARRRGLAARRGTSGFGASSATSLSMSRVDWYLAAASTSRWFSAVRESTSNRPVRKVFERTCSLVETLTRRVACWCRAERIPTSPNPKPGRDYDHAARCEGSLIVTVAMADGGAPRLPCEASQTLASSSRMVDRSPDTLG